MRRRLPSALRGVQLESRVLHKHALSRPSVHAVQRAHLPRVWWVHSTACLCRHLPQQVCMLGRLSGRAYHKQISCGSSTTLLVFKLVHVVPELLPVDHPIRGVQVWAGLVLDHEGVAQKGDDIDRSSQQHSVGGIPIINLQRVSRPGQAALQTMLCGLAMYSQTLQESLSGRDSAGRWPSLCRCTANIAQHYYDGYTSLHGMEGSKKATALWKTGSSDYCRTSQQDGC